jgi:hypothetical protein
VAGGGAGGATASNCCCAAHCVDPPGQLRWSLSWHRRKRMGNGSRVWRRHSYMQPRGTGGTRRARAASREQVMVGCAACQTCLPDPPRDWEDILDRMRDETIVLFTSIVHPRRENGKMTGVIRDIMEASLSSLPASASFAHHPDTFVRIDRGGGIMRTAQSVGFGSGDDHIHTRMRALVRWGFPSKCVWFSRRRLPVRSA